MVGRMAKRAFFLVDRDGMVRGWADRRGPVGFPERRDPQGGAPGGQALT